MIKGLYILILFFSHVIFAQSEIKGFVISDGQKFISRANIILFNEKNEIETFVFSNKDGSFSISTNHVGIFVLQVSAMGYHQKKIDIKITNPKEIINVDKVILELDRVREIKEVTIKNPIRIKKDTVEYSTERFSDGSEKNVEELLKKLPGITVENDGKIKFKDKEISLVMVEGDDLFERGYQTLTQNMPTNPVDKIQVVTNFSKNKLLKNIENSDAVALNLTLKDDAKGRWYGNLMLASTSYIESMRQGKLNIMNFTKRRKTYILFNANNLGVNEMNGVQYLINPSSDTNSENIGAVETISLVNLHRKNFQFEEKRTNFNNDKLGSFNHIFNFKNDWKLKFVTIYNQIENKNYVDSNYKFLNPSFSFENYESKTWKQNNTNIIGKLELSKDFKDHSNLNFYNKVSSIKEDNDNLFLFNNASNTQTGNNKLFSSEHKLVFTKKLDSSKAWVGIGRLIYQNRPYEFWDQNNIAEIITGLTDAKKMYQKIESRMFYAGSKFTFLKSYTEKSKFELQLGNEFRNQKLNSQLQVLNDQNQNLNYDNSEYINHFDYQLNDLFFNLKRSFSIAKWHFSGGINQHWYNSNINLEFNNQYIIAPNVNVAYQYKSNGTISFSGSRKLTPLKVEQLYTQYIYQGNRNFNKNGVDFDFMPDYNLGFIFTLGNPLSEQITASAFYQHNEKYLSNTIIANPNFMANQSILVKDNSTFMFNSEIRKYLKVLRSRISIFNNYLTSNYQNSVNEGPLQTTAYSSYKLGLEMKSGWLKKINYEFGYEWNFNTMKSSNFSNSYIDQRGFFNLYYRFTDVVKLQSNLDYFNFGNTTQRTTQFLDMKLDYKIKKHKLDLFISANNLLNSDTIQRYSIDNISESLYTQRLLPRNIVFGINVSF